MVTKDTYSSITYRLETLFDTEQSKVITNTYFAINFHYNMIRVKDSNASVQFSKGTLIYKISYSLS